MPFKKGQPRPATSGRKKGIPNKATTEVKAAIQQAFEEVGGHIYLRTLASKYPNIFCTLLGKIIPTEIKAELSGPGGGPMVSEVTVEHHAPPAAVEPAPGGSDRGQAHPAVPPGPVSRVAVNGAVHSGAGGDS